MPALLSIALLACSGTTATAALEGTVTTADYEATVSISHGFGFDIDGTGFFYFPSNPDATCEDVVAYLTHSSSSEAYDPTQVWTEGTCVLSLKLTSYDGGDYSFTEEQNWLEGFLNMNCAMGEGEFIYEESDNGYWDYYWTNNVWSGIAGVHTTDVTAVDESSYTVTTEVSGWEGNYVEEFSGEQIPLDGAVSGSVELTWCSDLYDTGQWGR
jgi:hypothetical protein